MKFLTKLSIMITALFLASFSVMFYLGYRSTIGIMEQDVKDRLEGQAFQIMDKIDRMLFERFADMSALAADPALRSRTSTSRQITQRLEEYRRISRIYHSLSFFDMNRVRIADTSGRELGKQHALTSYWREIGSGRDAIMTVARSRTTGQIALHFVAAVKDWQGRRIGVVASRMPIESVQQIADQTRRRGRERKPCGVELLDANGLLLYSNYHEKGMLREKASDWEFIKELLAQGGSVGSARHEFGGEEEITAFAREQGHDTFKGNGWVLTICIPVKTALAAADAHTDKFIALFLSLGLVVTVSSFFASRLVTKPLHELSRAAAEIGQGSRDVSVRVRSKDEIGQLAEAFNAMARDLKESEGKFRALAELLPQLVYELDSQGNVMFINRYALEALGYEQGDISRGLNIRALVSSEAEARLAEDIKKGLNGEHINNVEYTVFRKDGSSFPILTFAAPIVRDGIVTGMRGIGIDMTERKKAEESLRESEARLRTIVDTVQTGILMIDAEKHIITDVNPVAEKMIGAPKDVVVGSECHAFICPAEKGKCPITDLGQSTDDAERILLNSRGEQRSVIKTVVPVILDGKRHLLESFVDITERKQAEATIRKMNEELELKVQERTKQLLDAQAELVRKEKLATLGQLAGTVGHELRNPLGVMNNAVYYLQTVLGDADGIVKEYLGIIKSEIAGAERIVSDLLDAVRTKPPRLQPVLAEDLIRMSLAKCRIPERVKVSVQSATRQSVLIDPHQMKQAFINLINNAVDAMAEGGTLRITAEDDEHSARVRFVFRDEGAGIAPENLTQMFQPLFTTKARGIGLGLVVVKNLTKANGGTVVVESEPGKGTTFTMTLPAAADAPQA